MSPPEAHASPSLPLGVIPALVAALAIAQLLIFWPGVISPDSLWQYAQALSGHYEDWHPPVMAFLWRQLGRLASGQAPFLVMDALLYWGGVLLLADSLQRRGRRRTALAVVAIATMPIPFGQLGAIVKDSLLAACCLAAVGLAAQAGRTTKVRGSLLPSSSLPPRRADPARFLRPRPCSSGSRRQPGAPAAFASSGCCSPPWPCSAGPAG